MRSVLSALLMIALTFWLSLTTPVPARASTLAALPGLSQFTSGTRPENIGVTDGRLASCPETPNCVVSQGRNDEHAIAPIVYTTDRQTALQTLIDILGVVPRTKIVTQNDDYILAESESRLMGFVDDSEFYFAPDKNVIHLRAAARLGESDLGVNRRRMEQIRLAFQDWEQRTVAQ